MQEFLAVPDGGVTQQQTRKQSNRHSTGIPLAGKKIAYSFSCTLCHQHHLQDVNRIHLPQQQRSLVWKPGTFSSPATIMQIHGRATTLEQCAGGYDDWWVSHGGQEYAYDFPVRILEQYPGFEDYRFDTPFKDANGETAKIDGVTQFFPAGWFAESLVQARSWICIRDKTEAGEPVNILQVQQGADITARSTVAR